MSVQSTVLVGALYLAIIALFGLGVFAVVYIDVTLSPVLRRGEAKRVVREKFEKHMVFYSLLGVLILLTVVLYTVFRMPNVSGRFDDAHLQRVVEVQLNPDEILSLKPDLLFLSRVGGWLVLKRSGQKRFVMLKEDHVVRLELEPPIRSAIAMRP
jgi:hypothetical protein